ncbi:protein-L-isoaspartate O-methyltransferase [Uliginosibacterium sp. 31-16]|uniref:protein-L-isoaspartate O-methyltransferase family protein n=1 Tax=Uliginosibacterium sp. 31-16 TaxID=3068315 RepID=UPI00273EFCD3|nr:protein-L-isoaspartate O-methyltransferase [Uliginosibacterium sp. 31-16]MDP5238391.1 protein-L-isoaspartate O-methyltransferase [Uliginosibacterium sp. 31-16]
MDIEQARFNMIEQQIRTCGVLEPGTLEALAAVRRERFVPPALQALAFADLALPIGKGQFMLEPKNEARVLQALQIRRGENVLEIGTGSGFMAALLAARGALVRSLEIEPTLATQARINLDRAGVDNVLVEDADGAAGEPECAPYDLILASGSVEHIPQVWLEQLKMGGRVFAFVGTGTVMKARMLTRVSNGYRERDVFETVVPPLRLARATQFRL